MPLRTGKLGPEYSVPLSPAIRPTLQRFQSASTLPNTPHTPYEPAGVSSSPHDSGLKPYPSLWPRLLLTTLSPALLPLIFTIAHLVQNRTSTADIAKTLRASLLSACSGLAKGAASLQTLPRYLAMQTNEDVVRATQASILALGTLLMDLVTVIEKVLEFVLDTYRSLLMCTIELAVRGTLEVLIAAVKQVRSYARGNADSSQISDSITSSLNSIRTGIQNDIASANNFIQSAASKLNVGCLPESI